MLHSNLNVATSVFFEARIDPRRTVRCKVTNSFSEIEAQISERHNLMFSNLNVATSIFLID